MHDLVLRNAVHCYLSGSSSCLRGAALSATVDEAQAELTQSIIRRQPEENLLDGSTPVQLDLDEHVAVAVSELQNLVHALGTFDWRTTSVLVDAHVKPFWSVARSS